MHHTCSDHSLGPKLEFFEQINVKLLIVCPAAAGKCKNFKVTHLLVNGFNEFGNIVCAINEEARPEIERKIKAIMKKMQKISYERILGEKKGEYLRDTIPII